MVLGTVGRPLEIAVESQLSATVSEGICEQVGSVRAPRPPWPGYAGQDGRLSAQWSDTAIIMATRTRPGMNCHPMTVRCGEGLPSLGGRRGGACLCSAVHACQTITGKGSTTGDGMGSNDHASRPSSRHRDRLEPPPLSVTHHGKAIVSGQQQWSGDVPPTDHGPTAARQSSIVNR